MSFKGAQLYLKWVTKRKQYSFHTFLVMLQPYNNILINFPLFIYTYGLESVEKDHFQAVH